MGWGIFSQWVGWGDEGGGKRSLSPRSKGCAKCGSNSSKIVSSLSSFQYFGFFFKFLYCICTNSLLLFGIPSSMPSAICTCPLLFLSVPSTFDLQLPLCSAPSSLSYCLSLLLSRSPHLTSCRFCYIIHTVPTVFSKLNTRGSSR